MACGAEVAYDLSVRIHSLRGAKLEESVLGASSSRARPVIRVLDEGLEAAALAVRATAGAIFMGQSADSLCCVAAFGPDAKLLLDRGAPPNRDEVKRAHGPRAAQCDSSGRPVLLAALHQGNKPHGHIQLENPN